ncbi:MAG: IS4 family transposase [Verrucomicrobia bacterium]|nr:MAG: IS4 family transposase [Verrucomicrobiota bacterium]
MCTTLDGPTRWAQMEFALAELGDARLSRRLVQVASAIAQFPSGTLPQALPEWSELKAAYRLFSNPKVSYEAVIEPHWQRTRQSCCEPGEYLFLEDATELDFSSHQHTRGLGWLGDWGYGLKLNTVIAARVEAWTLDHSPEVSLLGIAAQHCWARTERSWRRVENSFSRLKRRRESEPWARVFGQMPQRPAGVTWIQIADRDYDAYEVFERCQASGADFIVRAKKPRVVIDEAHSSFEAVAQAPVRGSFELEIRTRPELPARVARVQVRTMALVVRGVIRPGGRRPDLSLNIVQVEEIDPPAGVELIHWILLTSLPCERWLEARRVVARYARRWLVEEYHKALKSGAKVEASQLESIERLKPLIAILAVVALRLLNTKLLARARPDQPIHAEDFSPEAIRILNARFGEPKSAWTHATLLIAIARMGGFLARRGDGPPGWLTIWRGWSRLMTMADGVKSLSQPQHLESSRCG